MSKSGTRLAIFVPSMAGGGAEKSMLRLADGLARRGHDVDLVLARAIGPYLAEIPRHVRMVDLKAKRVLSSLPALVRYLRQERPSAMVSTLDYANIVALWAHRLAGAPHNVVVNEQNTISLTTQHSSRWRQQFVPLLIKQFYPWADHIIGNSQGVADDLCKITGLPAKEILVLYNPVITPELAEMVKISPNHPWFNPGQPPVLLAVGRLTAQKDFSTLVRAFQEVRRHQSARLMILGEGPDRPLLEAQVRELGLEEDVSLPGFVENPYAFMAKAAVFVLSSRWEGLPTVLIEALFCGAPIVATNCPSGPREILAEGRYGALTPVQDVAGLATKIMLALTGQTPRPTVASWQPYELETVVNQYSHLLLK